MTQHTWCSSTGGFPSVGSSGRAGSKLLTFELRESPECVNHTLSVSLFVRFLLHLAEKTDGIIVTNDNLRDFVNTSDTWRKIIQER